MTVSFPKKTGKPRKKGYKKWPTTRQEHLYLMEKQYENIQRSQYNPNENWFSDKLQGSELKWTRQARWGYRIFDFWNWQKGLVIEIDGPEHDAKYESERDKENLDISGIRVIRVRNRNETDAAVALEIVKQECLWWERRKKLGLKYESSTFGYKKSE